MKYMITEPNLDVLMKKYGDPISNEINYVAILYDAANFGENDKNKKDDISTMQKLNDKEFIPSLSNANNFYTYQ